MAGKLFCVGVGPGDHEYLTLKAKRVIDNAMVVAAPAAKSGERSVALEIVKKAVDMSGKEILELSFSMSPNEDIRKQERILASEKIKEILDGGRDVVMITLGDVSIYSTCSYITNILINDGYSVSTVAGVPSFSAAAACADIRLCEGDETLAVIPAVKGTEQLNKILDLFDNVVIMKAGKKMNEIYECLKNRGLEDRALVASEVGRENGFIVPISDRKETGYFTTVIIIKNGLR